VRNPPVRTGFYVVGQPAFPCYVPLCWKREVVITTLGKIALLVPAAVNKRDIFQRERANRVGVRKVTQHHLRVLMRVAEHVCHSCLLPAVELHDMTAPATPGAHKVWPRTFLL